MYDWLDHPRDGTFLCVGESPRDHPSRKLGMRVARSLSGVWAVSERARWRYVGVLVDVLPTEMPPFLRARVGVDESFAYLAEP